MDKIQNHALINFFVKEGFMSNKIHVRDAQKVQHQKLLNKYTI